MEAQENAANYSAPNKQSLENDLRTAYKKAANIIKTFKSYYARKEFMTGGYIVKLGQCNSEPKLVNLDELLAQFRANFESTYSKPVNCIEPGFSPMLYIGCFYMVPVHVLSCAYRINTDVKDADEIELCLYAQFTHNGYVLTMHSNMVLELEQQVDTWADMEQALCGFIKLILDLDKGIEKSEMAYMAYMFKPFVDESDPFLEYEDENHFKLRDGLEIRPDGFVRFKG